MEAKDLIKLKEPMSSKWRVQSAFPKARPVKVNLIAYNDARDIQDRLDDVCGQANWQSEFYESKGKQFCKIGIKVGDEWIWKSDSGSPSNTEKEKGESSDAFKRAAVHWGINRAAYQYGMVTLPCKEYNGKYYPCDDSGSFLKGEKLYDKCNELAKIDDFQALYEKMEEESNVNHAKALD